MNPPINIIRQGVGEPLVLIHGWAMNANIFEPIVPLLSTHFEVIRVDLPGHGRSGWQDGLGLNQQVECLAEILPASSLLGWSMGGLLASRLVKSYPHQFKKLILLSSNSCFVQKSGWVCAVERAVFDEFSRSLLKDWRATIRRFIGLQLTGVANARELIRQVADLLEQGGEPDPAAMSAGLDLLLTHDARTELEALELPILAILGARDKLVPKCMAREFPLINPRIRVELLAQSAHAPFVSHAEIVADLIREFIISPAS